MSDEAREAAGKLQAQRRRTEDTRTESGALQNKKWGAGLPSHYRWIGRGALKS